MTTLHYEREKGAKLFWKDSKSKHLGHKLKELTFHLHYKSGFPFSDEQLPYDDAWREKQERYTAVINMYPGNKQWPLQRLKFSCNID